MATEFVHVEVTDGKLRLFDLSCNVLYNDCTTRLPSMNFADRVNTLQLAVYCDHVVLLSFQWSQAAVARRSISTCSTCIALTYDLNFNAMRLAVMTLTRAKDQGQRSIV